MRSRSNGSPTVTRATDDHAHSDADNDATTRRRTRPARDPGPTGRGGGPALLAQPRGAGGDARVPRLPPPRVPRPRRGMGRGAEPSDGPEADGGVAGPGRRLRLLVGAGREDRPLRPDARADRPGQALVLRHA